jgi:hypothetical protein
MVVRTLFFCYFCFLVFAKIVKKYFHMENTILIQLTNQKAAGLLHELEELNLIKVLKENSDTSKTKLSEKYKGFINKKDGKDLSEHLKKMRDEWNSI